MSQAVMEALVDKENCYASPIGTFIEMYNTQKDLHILSKFSMDNMLMQEVSYHISTGLSVIQHKNKEAPWPTLPLQIGLYEIQNLKHVDFKMEEFKRFSFGTRSFNPYDPHCLVMDQCARVHHPWIHEACHQPKEDPWIYYYHFSRFNEQVRIDVQQLAMQKETTYQRATSSAVADDNKPVLQKHKRKLYNNIEVEKICKFKEGSLVLKQALEIKAKR